jgi:glycosyltransferase involved in cell wall biosynthesis
LAPGEIDSSDERGRHLPAEEDLQLAASRLKLAYIIGTYPLQTTTFIDREIEALRRLGVDPHVISIRRPPHALSAREEDGVQYVLPVGIGSLLRSHLGIMISRPRVYFGLLVNLLTRPHETVAARLRTVLHFGVGVHTARLISERHPSEHVHAHFVDRAALIALIAGQLLEIPFSATAHANDIYVDPVLLPDKIERAKFIATCTRHNESHLLSILGAPARRVVRCIYHGLDIRDYSPRRKPMRARPLILAVGQLKEKKGFRYLLAACRILTEHGVEFDCEIVGDGPEHAQLQALIQRLSLQHNVSLLGSLPHAAVIDRYGEAAIFVLPCVTGADGDRDGIPNVILEAMAMGLPVVSTQHSGIPEAVDNERSGLLVPPEDPIALADALQRLIEDEGLRRRYGRVGRRRVIDAFDVDVNARKLLAEFVA